MDYPVINLRRLILSILIAFSLAACAATNNPNDPYERYNRVIFKINDSIDSAVIAPTARGYQKVIPKPVRAGIGNVFDNMRDVVSFGSNALRLDIEKAATDFSRFGLNTSFGLGGLINIADMAEIPNNKNTLGDTFASWGWKNSNYFIFPLSGPSTVRDTTGGLIIATYSPESALIHNSNTLLGTSILRAVDNRSRYLGLTDALVDAAPDKYAYVRDMYMGIRARQTDSNYGLDNDASATEDDIDSLIVPVGIDENDIDNLIEPVADDTEKKTQKPSEHGLIMPGTPLLPINPAKIPLLNLR